MRYVCSTNMAVINYREEIQETIEELLKLERAQKQSRQRDRVRFLRFLKQGEATSQPQAGERIGLKRRQRQVLWKSYKEQGLQKYLTNNYKGSWSKLSSHQQARLLQRLDQDDISSQQQLIDWLKAEMGISYTQGGLSGLLARLKVKLKTGRPVNVRKDEAGQEAFKKTSIS
jgi:transposase